MQHIVLHFIPMFPPCIVVWALLEYLGVNYQGTVALTKSALELRYPSFVTMFPSHTIPAIQHGSTVRRAHTAAKYRPHAGAALPACAVPVVAQCAPSFLRPRAHERLHLPRRLPRSLLRAGDPRNLGHCGLRLQGVPDAGETEAGRHCAPRGRVWGAGRDEGHLQNHAGGCAAADRRRAAPRRPVALACGRGSQPRSWVVLVFSPSVSSSVCCTSVLVVVAAAVRRAGEGSCGT